MKILFAASEVVPFAKTGGLADVAGTLPRFLKQLGHDVRIIMPRYQVVDRAKYQLKESVGHFVVPVGDRLVESSLLEGRLNDIPVYFVEKDRYFDRPELYGTPHGDYPDNAERFIFFSRSVPEAARALGFQPDIIHCNDWQTALVPVYLKTLYGADPFFSKTSSVFTTHNMGYQGRFWHLDLPLTGLPWDLFTHEGLEFYGQLNLLKGGLVFADALTTVSKTYSREIQTPEHGYGLEGVLQFRKKDLHGIINGIDPNEWDPATDKALAATFSGKNLAGKAKTKKALQKELGLPATDVPLLAFVGRLADQKGVDLLASAIEQIPESDAQFVILGSGDERYHQWLSDVTSRNPRKLALRLAFDGGLARRIYAAADIFLMPSRYEPCGLGQLISLRYGTIPVVHLTGGLADTIKEFSPGAGKGNGFTFRDFSLEAFHKAISRALKVYGNSSAWKTLIRNAMECDFSWDNSAREYETLYKKLARKRK